MDDDFERVGATMEDLQPINIVCVKWGTLYSAEYVNKLYRGVERNTTIPFKFICFTEDTTGIDTKNIECRQLPNVPGVEGWWLKMSLFGRDARLKGRVFFLDLDTVIVGNLDEMLRYEGNFIVIQDFYSVRNNRNLTNYGSGLMAWEDNWNGMDMWNLYLKESPERIKRENPKGDQQYLQKIAPGADFWQERYPNQVVSYKVHIRGQEVIPENARIVCFHGKPRPIELNGIDWMEKNWI